MGDIVITPASNDVNSTAGTLVIRTSDAQAMSLKTNDTDRIFIASAGKVGIGTATNISGVLHVHSPDAGNQTLLVLHHSAGYATNTENRLDFFDDETHKIAARIAQYYSAETNNRWGLKFYTNSSTAINSIPALTLLGRNAVGIGTANPNGMFHVHCTQNGSGEVYFTSNTGNINQNNDSPKLILAGEYQTAGVSLQAVNVAAYGRKDLVILQHDANDYVTAYEAMRLSYGGTLTLNATNKDINVLTLTSPSSATLSNNAVLDISRGGGAHKGSAIRVTSANYSDSNKQAFIELNAAAYGGANTRYINCYDDDRQSFVVLANARVGIGTASPGAALEVSGSAIIGSSTYGSSYGHSLRIPFGAGDLTDGTLRGHLQFDSVEDYSVNGGDAWKWKLGAVARPGNAGNYNSQFEILRSTRAGVTDNPDFVINRDGNIGIGMRSPTNKIQISGGGISFTTSTGLAVQMIGIVLPTNIGYIGPYNSPADGNSPTVVALNHAASVQQTWFYSSGRIAMSLNREGRFHIGNLNNAPNCLLSVGPTSATTAVSGMCFGNDASANLYRLAAGQVKTDGQLVAVGGFYSSATAGNYIETLNIGTAVIIEGGATEGLYLGDSSRWLICTSDAACAANADGDLHFRDNANSVTRMIINYASGFVGIGTVVPVANLEVAGASETVGTIRINGGKVNILAEGEINSSLEFAQRDASVAGLVAGKIASISEFSNGAYAGLGFYTAQQSRVPELKEAVRIKYDGTVGIGTTSPYEKLDVRGGILRTNTRVSNTQLYPLGHYSAGEPIFEIDPSWSEVELQRYFNSSNVTWVAVADAPGGYCIYIDGGVNVGGFAGSGFPYIPVDTNDIFYMECWIQNVGTSQGHYMGSQDFDHNFANLGGNPGSYGYWVMSNYNPTTTWTKVSGYISGFSNTIGEFKAGTKYWTPQALFNYTAGTGTRACRISGWKVIKVYQPGNRYFSGNIGIGTTNAVAQLHIGGTASNSNPWMVLDVNDTYFKRIIFSEGRSTYGTTGYGGYIGYDADNNVVSLGVYENSTQNRVLNIRRENGNVGIGTTNPNTLLNVHGADPFVRINNTSANDQGIKISYNNSDTHGLHLLYNANSAVSYIDNTYPVLSTFVYGDIYFRQNVAGTMTTRMTIKGDGGNVGIGTTSPSTPLHVFNTAATLATFTRDLATDVGFSIGADSNGTVFSTAGAHAYQFYTNSTEKVRITSDGNFGIGTSTPLAPLHVGLGGDWPSSTGTSAMVFIKQKSSNVGLVIQEPGNASFDRALHLYTNGSLATIDATYRDTGPYPDIAFVTSGTVRARINSDGNVGIGTNSPYSRLDLQLASAATRYLTLSTNDGQGSYNGFGLNFRIADQAHDIAQIRGDYENSNGGGYGGLFIATRFSGTLYNRLSINDNGRVGIGVSYGTTLLSVGGAGSTSAASGITFGGDAEVNLYRVAENNLQTDAALNVVGSIYSASYFYTAVGQIYGSTYGNLTFFVGNSAGNAWQEGMFIKRGSYVGIGTTNPTGKLHIVSSVAGETVLRADGTNGTLFSVVDDLSDSLMSVNNSAGLPVLEVFADDRVVAGQYGSGDFVLINNKVGLGTSNPTNKLTVIGAASIGSSTYNIAAPSNGLIVQGNVGIGLTNPTQKLHVKSSATQDGIMIDAATYSEITYKINGSAIKSYLALTSIAGGYVVGSSANSFIIRNDTDIFMSADAGATSNITIKNGGNVGIGITNPSSLLHLQSAAPTILTLGSTSYPSTFLTTLGVDSGARGFLIFGNNGENQIRAGRTTAGGYLDFYTNNTVAQTTLASDGNLVMRLAANGNVGIGNVTPSAARLHIKTDNTNPALRIEDPTILGPAGGTAGKTFAGWLPIMTGAAVGDKVFIPLFK